MEMLIKQKSEPSSYKATFQGEQIRSNHRSKSIYGQTEVIHKNGNQKATIFSKMQNLIVEPDNDKYNTINKLFYQNNEKLKSESFTKQIIKNRRTQSINPKFKEDYSKSKNISQMENILGNSISNIKTKKLNYKLKGTDITKKNSRGLCYR